jgi:hypothetical protein
MLRAWRRAAVAALAGAAALAAQFAVIAPAQAAAPTITINATTKLTAVAKATGDALVVYHASAGAASAAIHGKITGVTKGEVAALYAQQFPFTKAAVKAAAVTIKVTGNTTYSFKVTPTLATRYKVRLFASATAKSALALSATQYVYVTELGSFPNPPTQSCGNTPPVTCHVGFSFFEFLPSSALSTEINKHVNQYFGINLGPVGTTPPVPKFLILNAGGPSATVHKINAGEFKISLSWTFNIGSHAARWDFNACTKDTVSKDGLGLPGSHSCGVHQIPAASVYLG